VTQLIPYSLAATLVYQDNPNFAADMAAGKKTFVGSNWEKVFAQYEQMSKEGCFQDKPLGTSYEVSTEMVGKGQAAAVVNGNWALDPIKKAGPAGATFVMKPLPATDDANQTWMPLAGTGSYGLNKKAKNEAAAKAFLNFLMSPQGMSTYMGIAGGLPSISDPGFKLDPALKVLDEYNASGKSAPFMDQLWPNAKVQQVHFVVVADMFGGKATPADMAKRMDTAYTKG
jgi:raffinose/stachyose/melibiose transport system substrate-binding protein